MGQKAEEAKEVVLDHRGELCLSPLAECWGMRSTNPGKGGGRGSSSHQKNSETLKHVLITSVFLKNDSFYIFVYHTLRVKAEDVMRENGKG